MCIRDSVICIPDALLGEHISSVVSSDVGVDGVSKGGSSHSKIVSESTDSIRRQSVREGGKKADGGRKEKAGGGGRGISSSTKSSNSLSDMNSPEQVLVVSSTDDERLSRVLL